MLPDPYAEAANVDAPSLADALHGMSMGMLWMTPEACVLEASPCVGDWLGRDAATLAGQSLFDVVGDFTCAQWQALQADPAARAGQVRMRIALADGSHRVVGVRAANVMRNGADVLALLLLPIEDRLDAESVQGLQREVLESIALGRPLRSVFDLLCRRVEALAPSVVCSVVLVEKNGTIKPVAGPSLPPAYVEALHGAPIGPRAGSCGTAAWRREPVEVTDIYTDPLWADYASLLPLLDMGACWSTPIIAPDGEVVATFALYYREPGAAPAFHRRMVEACVPLCRIALQHEANRIEIERLAYFDQLTGLPNRRLFSDRVRQTLQMAMRIRSGGGWAGR